MNDRTPSSSIRRLRLLGEMGAIALGVLLALACSQDAITDPSPRADLDEPRFTAIVAGEQHTCALDDRGAAFCWGSNPDGQLGVAETLATTSTPTPVDTDVRFSTLAAGAYQTCGVGRDGHTYCWGRSVDGDRTRPQPVTQSLQLKFLSSRSKHICGVTGTGTVACWGEGFAGQLGTGGHGATADAAEPQILTSAPALILIATGEAFSCGIDQAGQAHCWGAHDVGQLGTGTGSPGPCVANDGILFPCSPTPWVIVGGLVLTRLAAGSYHACAVGVEGFPYCWGDNTESQLGRNDMLDSCQWVDGAGSRPCSRVAVVANGQGAFVTLVAGGFHTCGLDGHGSAFCWGSNRYGQIGDGTLTTAKQPVRVLGGLSFVSLTAGRSFTCGLTNIGEAYCWGDNGLGQSGEGGPVLLAPTKVVSGKGPG